MMNLTLHQSEKAKEKRHMDDVIMNGVTEYNEEMNVVLSKNKGKFVVEAKNECGYNSTSIDLDQLLKWVATNRTEIYMKHVSSSMLIAYG